jgi:hypothetical protein
MLLVVNAAAIDRGVRACVLTGILCFGGHSRGEGNPPPEVPIQSWLEGSDRQDFPWRVALSPAWLTFQQRRFVQTRITFRVRDLLKAGVSPGDLHVIVKLAGDDGRWLPGQSYSHFEPPPNLAAGDEIHSLTNLYVRQGTYKIAVMAYDSVHHRGNLWRGPLQVGRVKDDPLPGIEHFLPEVEFLPAAKPLHVGRSRGLASMITFDPWALGHGELLLPVVNSRPVQVDIVANVSLSAVTDWHNSEAPDWEYQLNGANLLQISNVISQLDLQDGCVRLSALDVRRQKIFVDRQDARTLDWSNLQKAIKSVNRTKIEASTLAGEKNEPAFLARYLEQLSSQPFACQASGPAPLHVLIIVSDAFVFPNGARMTTVRQTPIPGSVCYHLRVVPVAGGRWDEFEMVVQPWHPVKFDFADARRFRKALAQLITGIKTASQPSAATTR